MPNRAMTEPPPFRSSRRPEPLNRSFIITSRTKRTCSPPSWCPLLTGFSKNWITSVTKHQPPLGDSSNSFRFILRSSKRCHMKWCLRSIPARPTCGVEARRAKPQAQGSGSCVQRKCEALAGPDKIISDRLFDRWGTKRGIHRSSRPGNCKHAHFIDKRTDTPAGSENG